MWRLLGPGLWVLACLCIHTWYLVERGKGRGGGYMYIFPAMVPVQWLLLSDSRGLLSVLFPAPKFFLADTGLRREPKAM